MGVSRINGTKAKSLCDRLTACFVPLRLRLDVLEPHIMGYTRGNGRKMNRTDLHTIQLNEHLDKQAVSCIPTWFKIPLKTVLNGLLVALV